MLRLVPADEAAHIDALAGRASLRVQELAGVLLGLELRELVRAPRQVLRQEALEHGGGCQCA